MIPFSVLSLAFYIVAVLSAPLDDTDPRPTACLDSGVVVGTTTSLPSSTATVNKFLGIPFAAPPVRFSPPQPPTPWVSPYDASEYKHSCVQQFNYPELHRNLTLEWFGIPGPPAGESEDCLNLNVFVPASAEEGSKPVLFWIHGGSFSFGSGSIPLYDGSSFAANQDVVVVTVNYRLNVFGFPGSPELPDTERNLGWLDQRLALDWVHRNIAALGGDPERVTIAGESAGAGSVDALVTAPPEPIPFHAAIMQSGQATLHMVTDPENSWNEVVKDFDCAPENALECLRAVPVLELKKFIEKGMLDFGPVPDDGTTWTDTSRTSRLNSTDQEPLIARVPVLIGSNADEGRTSAFGLNDTEKFIRSTLGENAPDEVVQILLKAYPIGSPGISDELEQISAVQTDFSFHCPAKIVAEESAMAGIDSWRYYLNGSFPNAQLFKFENSGVYHTSEISLVFDTYEKEGTTGFQVEVSEAMQAAWARFAKDPSSGPGWDPVRRVGVFGGGARPGLDDTGRETLTTIDGRGLDSRCALYKTVYDTAK